MGIVTFPFDDQNQITYSIITQVQILTLPLSHQGPAAIFLFKWRVPNNDKVQGTNNTTDHQRWLVLSTCDDKVPENSDFQIGIWVNREG